MQQQKRNSLLTKKKEGFMFRIRKYHEKKVMSLTYDGENTFSVGIIAVGEFAFGALIDEYYRITSGEIDFWNDETERWVNYKESQEFKVKKGHNYKLKVDGVSSYICFYK
ncbi:MAG: hypothetical protein DRI84_01920 [Bacteroidetes bacterium]|nr:MAG: hypothetical protein DRI84_01920 [Bacteroidota bacterium]